MAHSVPQYAEYTNEIFIFKIEKCIFIYGHEKSTVFPAPIITKLINVQQHYVQMVYTEFQHDRAVNVGSMDENLFYGPVKRGFTAPTFR